MQTLTDNIAIDYLYDDEDFPVEIWDAEMIEFCIQQISNIDFEELNEEGFLNFLEIGKLPPRDELKELCRREMIKIAKMSSDKIFTRDLKEAVLKTCKMQLPEYYVQEIFNDMGEFHGMMKDNVLIKHAIDSLRWNIISDLIIMGNELKPTEDVRLEAIRIATIHALMEYREDTSVELKNSQIESFMETNEEEIMENAIQAVRERIVLEHINNVVSISTKETSAEFIAKKLMSYD